MSYILTESNPRIGFQGLVVDRKEYIETPYFDRALFESLDEISETWYWCSLEVNVNGKKQHYLIIDDNKLGILMAELGLHQYFDFVVKELHKGKNASLSLGEFRVYNFSPILS